MQTSSIIGLPWQLAEGLLRAAKIPFAVTIGDNYNRFFTVADSNYYVGRVTIDKQKPEVWQILLFRPMIASEFENCNEVQYAKEFIS
ncbi:hypothetical protein [Veillonella sp.]|uniref:hypothetical protein n=1 Tax=Veillonella sp. TaxID=1926307 RepID=UPI0025DF1C47|nr:hypothetical protein [Veillonella sp.]